MATNMMGSLAKLGFFPANGTVTNETVSGIPPGLMDTFLASAGHASPLLQVIIFLYRQLSVSLGLDPSLLFTTLGFFWGAQYFFNQTWHYVEDMVERHLMCSISVNQNDDIYDHLMQWLSKQPKLNNSRYLMAQTMWRSAWEEDEEDGNGVGNRLYVAGAEKGEYGKYLNFSNQAARYVSFLHCLQKADKHADNAGSPICARHGNVWFLAQQTILQGLPQKGIAR